MYAPAMTGITGGRMPPRPASVTTCPEHRTVVTYQKLASLCRHHHRCKQAEGWWLEQPEPGLLVWRVPSGRIYTTTPTEYPL